MNTRRQFLRNLTASSLGLAAATGCSSLSQKSGQKSGAGGIIDTHTHFYDPTRPQGVPFPGKDDTFLYRPVLPAELKSIAAPLGVTGTVVVEASPWVEDNEWVLNLARTEPFIQGLVGHLKPGKPDFARDLNRFAANPLFRGIRVGLWDIPLAPENSNFIRDLKLLADRNLSLDLLGGPDQITRISQIAAHIPKLRIVIDHCAGVRVTDAAPDPEWLKSIRMISAHQNIFMKVSALAEGTGREHAAPADVEFYRPTLDALWNAFGEDRVIYGSNWPVSARFADYPTVLKIVRDYTASKSEAAAQKYFHQNARRIYRLA